MGNLLINKIFGLLKIQTQNVLDNLIFGPPSIRKVICPKFFDNNALCSFHFHFINIYTHEYLSARKINTNNNIFLERKQNNFKNCCSTKGSCLGPVGSKDTL